MTAGLPLEELTRAALDHHRAGRFDQAEAGYRQILAKNGDHLNALQLLGALLVDTGRADGALPLLERAAALVSARGDEPQYSTLYNNLGNALGSLGRHDEAIAHYRRSLTLRPGDPEVHANFAGALLAQKNVEDAIAHYEAATAGSSRAEWHHKLASLYAAAGRPADAEVRYLAALSCNPNYVPALYDLGFLLRRNHRAGEAIPLFEHLIKVDPAHVEVHCALGNALRDMGEHHRAIDCFAKYSECLPDSVDARLHLGMTLSEVGQHEASLLFLERAVELEPKNTLALIELGNALLRVQRPSEAHGVFSRATAVEQFITRKAALPEPRFSALCVFSPGIANIPYDYLVGRAAYDAHMMWYLPGGTYDLDELRARSDVVVNLLSDADSGRTALPAAAAFVEAIGKPIVNHPHLIARTDRATISRLAAGVEGCRSARVVSIPGRILMEGHWPSSFTPPFLVRVAGRHGGDDFEMIERPDQLRAFAAQHPNAGFYVMDYVDVRSPDGFYRKYRFFGIGGEILPYHLAIASEWKVHHYRTDMANQDWMKQEEASFLEAPDSVFGERQIKALRALMQTIGLDYMGVDCALDADGNVVVFEANAAMLVHANNGPFPYKDKHVRRIKAAFDTMLERRATQPA